MALRALPKRWEANSTPGMRIFPALFAPLALTAIAAAVIGRALFYVLVIPTTMPPSTAVPIA